MAVLAAAVIVGACSGTPQARSITVTFVRNAQSQANADGVIDTNVPGPSLTAEGKGQAQQVVHQLSRNDAGGPRTPSTPRPWPKPSRPPRRWPANSVSRSRSSRACRRSTPAGTTANPNRWPTRRTWWRRRTGSNGDIQDSIPGSVSGKDFNDQFTAAVQKVYDSGHSKPVVFSQGTAIMLWTLMNVKNPKNSLLTSHPLPNIGRVVITGNPMDGWTLVDWDGIRNFS